MMRSQLKKIYRFLRYNVGILLYALSGKKPWSAGYGEHKRSEIARLCSDAGTLDIFARNQPLPVNHGVKIDERIVEYPWVFSRLRSKKGGTLLDAGSTLNFDFLLSNPVLSNRTVYIYNLAPEGIVSRPNVSYVYGDLRSTVFQDAFFDEIVCISTLEHVGMDNTFLYSSDRGFKESAQQDFVKVIAEFKRVLKPGGRLLITVPFGVHEHMGWFQQFDLEMVTRVVETFKGRQADVTYYRYSPSGWQMSSAHACANERYFDIHKTKKFDPDYAAASRAVACVELCA